MLMLSQWCLFKEKLVAKGRRNAEENQTTLRIFFRRSLGLQFIPTEGLTWLMLISPPHEGKMYILLKSQSISFAGKDGKSTMRNITASFRYTEDTSLVGPEKPKVLMLWNTQTASATIKLIKTFCSEQQKITAPISTWALCCCYCSFLPSEAFAS